MMNERIKELANKAVGKRSCYMIEAEYIKFAELIVRECMQVANEYQNRGGNCYVDNMIAKHFGVE
jgi:hypothetical protein